MLVAAYFLPPVENVWYTCFVYFLLFACTVVGLKFIYRETWINVIFCGIAAYAAQHMAYQFTDLVFMLVLQGQSPLLGFYHTGIVDISEFDLETVFWIAVYVMGYFTTYGAVWLLFGRKIEKNEDMKVKVKARSFLLLIGGCLLLNIVLNAVVLYADETPGVIDSVVRHVSAVFNCLLLLLWQFDLLCSRRLQTQPDITNKLLRQAQAQYKISKENFVKDHRKERLSADRRSFLSFCAAAFLSFCAAAFPERARRRAYFGIKAIFRPLRRASLVGRRAAGKEKSTAQAGKFPRKSRGTAVLYEEL